MTDLGQSGASPESVTEAHGGEQIVVSRDLAGMIYVEIFDGDDSLERDHVVLTPAAAKRLAMQLDGCADTTSAEWRR